MPAASLHGKLLYSGSHRLKYEGFVIRVQPEVAVRNYELPGVGNQLGYLSVNELAAQHGCYNGALKKFSRRGL